MNRMTKNERKDNHREAILNQAGQLIERVEQAYQQREAAHALEQGLFEQLLALGHQLLSLFFQLHGDADQGEQLLLNDGRTVKRLPTLHKREYLSVFGLFELERVVYGSREGQKIDYVALDAQLQLPANKFSYLLQQWDQGLAVQRPYLQVNETIQRILGFKQSVHSLERINGQLSESVDRFWQAHADAPQAQPGEIVVCSADAKGVVIRGAGASDEAGAEQASEPSSKTDGKKMALIGAAYTVAPYVRTPEQILQALFASPESDQDRLPAPSRPKPVAQYVRASLARDSLDHMAPSYSCIFDWLGQQQQQRNPDGKQAVVVLMDGQRSLWASAKEYFSEVWYIEILDLMHALGYLWDAAALFYPASAKAQRLGFVKGHVEQLLHGQVRIVIGALRAQASQLSDSQQKALADIIGYFSNNAERMPYDQYLQAGYPIASGVIEGACRHVVCDRMEHSGMRWVMAGAQAMLKLRCIALNHDWEPFMAFHIKQEQQRLYALRPANDEHFTQPLLAA